MSSTIGKGKPPWLGSWATRKLKSSHPVIAIDKSTNHVVWEDYWIGGTFLFPVYIQSGEEFGTPSWELTLSPSSIDGEESVSLPTLRLSLNTSGINGAEAFGTLSVRLTLADLGQITSQEQI